MWHRVGAVQCLRILMCIGAGHEHFDGRGVHGSCHLEVSLKGGIYPKTDTVVHTGKSSKIMEDFKIAEFQDTSIYLCLSLIQTFHGCGYFRP